MPRAESFGPSSCRSAGQINLTLDEFESVRLIDVEGMNQEQCAAQMGIARTTAQAIYNSARHKTGLALTEGLDLIISGGEYQLCHGGSCGCGKGLKGGCRRDKSKRKNTGGSK